MTFVRGMLKFGKGPGPIQDVLTSSLVKELAKKIKTKSERPTRVEFVNALSDLLADEPFELWAVLLAIGLERQKKNDPGGYPFDMD